MLLADKNETRLPNDVSLLSQKKNMSFRIAAFSRRVRNLLFRRQYAGDPASIKNETSNSLPPSAKPRTEWESLHSL